MEWPEAGMPWLIRDAYELKDAKGAALLMSMGNYDLWRGDLSQMRGDVPPVEATSEEPPPDADRFLRTLAISRSLNYLGPSCREVLDRTYGEGHDPTSAERTRVETCKQQLLEISSRVYENLVQSSGSPDMDRHSEVADRD
jgi:hypothetical protein